MLRAFVTKLSIEQIHARVSEGLLHPEWKKAMVEKMEVLEKNGTWFLTPLSEGKRTVGRKWVFTIKHNSDGSVQRYKAILVAKAPKHMELITWKPSL